MNEIIVRNKAGKKVPSMDELLTTLLLDKTMGEICLMWSQSSNIKTFTACDLIVTAISELDIGMINQIIKRVDGAIPTVEDRDQYANIIGSALDEVLAMPRDNREGAKNEHMLVSPDDSGIIALAKAILYISLDKPGKNISRKKDRQQATDILLSRTGGSRTTPVADLETTEYLDAPWLHSLGSGENNN